jgi:hypothetical protein
MAVPHSEMSGEKAEADLWAVLGLFFVFDNGLRRQAAQGKWRG